ncbi:MAG: hypothetical protein D6706_17925 [Chloroflexi bacterium]|nr:MAG: hypothetical protein D6706_17925 [Chloroflexota bacterium]
MSASHNYLFVSDLHLSEGRLPEDGRFSRNEDFFHDYAFARFVAYHVQLGKQNNAPAYLQKPWRLVINGDIFDFLQVVSLPAEGDELFRVRGVRTYAELSANERRYGLGTRPKEVVWKLQRIAAGHPLFFQALGWFLAHDGNELILLKGNHDIEIYWPEAQQVIRQLLVEAYDDWHDEVKLTGGLDSPLPFSAELPENLNFRRLETAVRFPPSFYLEDGLFYAEHGCQYEPANAFDNFENPTLPDNPQLIALPSGSFFVRYFFNKVEEIHPFADNMKPISRYLAWVIQNAPSAAARFLVDLLPRFLLAYVKSKLKGLRDWRRRMRGQMRAPQLEAAQFGTGMEKERLAEQLLTIQEQIRKQMRRASRMTTIGSLLSIVFRILGLILFLMALSSFVQGQFALTGIYLILGGLSGLLASMALRLLDKLMSAPYLQLASEAICRLLNDQVEKTGAARIPYFIFGHDHTASLRILNEEGEFPQWYVNTGAWIPVFSEEERLLRQDDQLTFLRLLPDHPEFKRRPPELLQWSAEADEPREIRLFADK